MNEILKYIEERIQETDKLLDKHIGDSRERILGNLQAFEEMKDFIENQEDDE
ncbi:MAG TPA: hypothetical protein VNU45_18125 [Rummeliibacillus sp.]|nr:hypothetical protein [Rummeliibacillus sp.]